MGFDMDAARAFALKVWRFKEGEVVSVMIHLGDRLGLFRAMADGSPYTSSSLAAATNLDERWVREWLDGMAAAGLIDRTAEADYSISPEAAAVLVTEDSLLYAVGGFAAGIAPQVIDLIVESFRTGIGFEYGDMDEATALQVDSMNGAWMRQFLVPVVIPMLEGVRDKLLGGGTALDVGCGGGVALAALATEYPGASFRGVDTSGFAISLAHERLRDLPNATADLVAGEDVEIESRYDLVMTLDMLHDAPRPDRVAAAVRRAMREDGTWLVKDMRCGPDYESNARNPLRAMMYGFSVTSCLASGTSTPDGAGLGTLGLHPGKVEEIARRAGFSRVEVHDLPDPTHLYYEIRI